MGMVDSHPDPGCSGHRPVHTRKEVRALPLALGTVGIHECSDANTCISIICSETMETFKTRLSNTLGGVTDGYLANDSLAFDYAAYCTAAHPDDNGIDFACKNAIYERSKVAVDYTDCWP